MGNKEILIESIRKRYWCKFVLQKEEEEENTPVIETKKEEAVKEPAKKKKDKKKSKKDEEDIEALLADLDKPKESKKKKKKNKGGKEYFKKDITGWESRCSVDLDGSHFNRSNEDSHELKKYETSFKEYTLKKYQYFILL